MTLRLVIPASQCGSLIGKAGAKIREIREVRLRAAWMWDLLFPLGAQSPGCEGCHSPTGAGGGDAGEGAPPCRSCNGPGGLRRGTREV